MLHHVPIYLLCFGQRLNVSNTEPPAAGRCPNPATQHDVRRGMMIKHGDSTHIYGKSPFLMGKPTIDNDFPDMFVYRRVTMKFGDFA